MTKTVLFLLLFFSIPSFAASKIPESESGIETGIDFRVIKKKKRFILLAETKNRKELLDNDYHQIMLGSYYRLTKRLRTGFFFQAEQGLRWDKDWIKDGTWEWQNIQGRWDYSTVADLTYADTINSRWTWEFKNRLSYYHSWDALLYRVRPGVRYFHFKEGKPDWQFYSEFEAYFPVNYGKKKLYEYWFYNGVLFQLTNSLSLGPVVSLRKRWFYSYDRFEKKTGEDYQATLSSLYLGISGVYSF